MVSLAFAAFAFAPPPASILPDNKPLLLGLGVVIGAALVFAGGVVLAERTPLHVSLR